MDGVSYLIALARLFRETWWFLGIAIGLVGAIALLLYRFHVRRLRETEQLRVQIASDLHDSLGAVLTRIAVHSERIQTMTDLESIHTAARAIGQASRTIVGSLADIVWSIDAREDTIGDLVDRMRDCLTDVLGSNHVDARLEHSGLDLQKRIPTLVRQNVYLIYKEAINNIACHSRAGHVKITLRNEPSGFTMCIADDGGGMSPSGRRTGQGLRNMKMRAERLAGEIRVQEDGGVSVTLTMRRL